jgi:AcrR family transcriptional regulator
MLTAAYDLFCADGFRATTMEAISERAGVAVQTVYFTFHTKDAMLQAVLDWAVMGDDALPPPRQPWYRAALEAPDPAVAIALIARGVTTIIRRTAPLVPVFQAAAADPAGETWRNAEALRLAAMRDLVDMLAHKSKLRTGVSRAHATDAWFVLLGPDLYRTLVIERGWSERQFEGWIARVIGFDLFGR